MNVFISYAREDRKDVAKLADFLTEAGHEVWWDWNLVGGDDFRAAIHEQLQRADKVIVLWSTSSINSAFVIDEASEAMKAKKIVPVLLDSCSPPLGFGHLHTLIGKSPARDFGAINAAICNTLPPPPPSPMEWKWQRVSALSAILLIFLLLVGAGVRYFWLNADKPNVAQEQRDKSDKSRTETAIEGPTQAPQRRFERHRDTASPTPKLNDQKPSSPARASIPAAIGLSKQGIVDCVERRSNLFVVERDYEVLEDPNSGFGELHIMPLKSDETLLTLLLGCASSRKE